VLVENCLTGPLGLESLWVGKMYSVIVLSRSAVRELDSHHLHRGDCLDAHIYRGAVVSLGEAAEHTVYLSRGCSRVDLEGGPGTLHGARRCWDSMIVVSGKGG
jgi:hypothetical protein